MILTRGGLDSKTQLPAGARISVHLTETATVATTGVPVIGIVTHDFVHEDSVAIPQGSKMFGQVTFNNDSDRAQIEWKSVQLPDGRERSLSAIGVSGDGQVGGMGLDSVIAMTGHKDLKLADHYSKIDGEVQKETSLKIVEHLKGLGMLEQRQIEAENVIQLRKVK